jgi:peptidoglycan/LPS O-acetylase OafA/YrhL
MTRVSPPHRNERNQALDGLRGIAIAMVVCVHLVTPYLPLGRGSVLGWLRAISDIGWCGVDLFFALSGFFIGGILIDNRSSRNLVKVFYLRRAARILPLYYATLATLGILILAGMQGSYHLFHPWVYATFLSNFAFASINGWDWLPLSVLWSLAVEEQFYLAAPWIARIVPAARVPALAIGLALTAEAARIGFVLVRPGVSLALHVLTPFRMDALALGVFAAWFVREDGGKAVVRFIELRWRMLLTIGLVFIAFVDVRRPPLGSRFLAVVGYLPLAMLCSLVVAVVARFRPPAICRVLENPLLVNLGRHAYFIYLWHGIIGVEVIRRLGGPNFELHSMGAAGVVALAISATWAASILSWKWFEGPIVAWSRRESY